MDKGDVKARVILAFGLCFEPCAWHRKDDISIFCGLGVFVFEVGDPNVVYHFLVCWFAIYFFEDGSDRSSAGVEPNNPAGFPPFFHVW
jgi:hypothetical protein